MRPALRLRQAGATMVEFALVLLIFLAFMLGVVDFSRMLFTWNAAAEVTRAGARYAVVCDDTSKKAEVLARMQMMLPQITDIDVTWDPPACTTTTCQGVTVSITGLDFQWISPVPGAVAPTLAMPGFSTYLTREIMRQDPAVVAQVCS
jgi:Flp pilus assembly protein TadG